MAYYPNNPNGQTTMANSAPVVIASDQSPVSINVSSDVFEQVVVGSRYNQIEVNYSQIDPDLITDITVTKTNGGDATNSSGQAVFSSGTNTNGGVSAVSNGVVYYNPHFETYAAFSAVFTTGIASSYQRIGLYDVSNGFFIGFNNTIFGVTLRKGGLDTFIGQSSFNVDTLTGASNSKFTRNGVPEAVDFTKDNLYRIRFGWLGAAPIFFEIYSPDGDWVVFNVIRHPNSSTSASINNPDLPVTLDIQKTGAGATNLTVSTGCWGAGTTSDLKKLSDTLTDNSLAQTVKSVLAAKDAGGNYINIGATLTGNLETAIAEVGAGVTFPITDNGGSITVDGTVAATQSGVWSVGVNNGSGASAVNIQDGGNSITVDGSVSVSNFPATQPISGTVSANLNAGTNYVGKVRLTDGTTDAEVVPLTGYNAQAVAIVDGSGNQVTSFGGGTQYADGTTVATPTGTVALGFDGVNVQALSTDVAGYLNVNVSGIINTNLDGTVINTAATLTTPQPGIVAIAENFLSGTAATIKGDGTNLYVTANNTSGDVAPGVADSGNPVKIGFKADLTTLASPVANGDRVDGIADRYGRQLVSNIDPGMQVWKSGEYTSSQTGTNIWVPTAGNRFVITSLHIATGGTTAGLVTIWGAQTATTAYTPGTDQVFFRGSLTPTANATPGALIQPASPFFSDTTNDCLKITTSANMTIYIQVNGYEITP